MTTYRRNRTGSITTSMLVSLLLIAPAVARAAIAPASPEQLKDRADLIISGRVIDVTSKTQKSEVEKAKGVHRDKVFTVTVEVKTVSKGKDAKAGEKVQFLAWIPSVRVPPLPGPQGHSSIPSKGDVITVHLRKKEGKGFTPILPNGIVIDKKAK